MTSVTSVNADMEEIGRDTFHVKEMRNAMSVSVMTDAATSAPTKVN
jgi:hypothetical protein